MKSKNGKARITFKVAAWLHRIWDTANITKSTTELGYSLLNQHFGITIKDSIVSITQ